MSAGGAGACRALRALGAPPLAPDCSLVIPSEAEGSTLVVLDVKSGVGRGRAPPLRTGAGGSSQRDEDAVGDAAENGARALGQPVGSIAIGCRADWLVLDAQHPSMAGASADTALDRLLFAGADKAIRDVMVGGRWVIRNHRHAADERLRTDFARTMVNLSRG